MQVLRYGQYPVQRWQNGAGTTRRIAQYPAETPDFGPALEWYIGLPDIEADAPFSLFPGMDRHLLLLSGKGLELHCRSSADHVDFRHRVSERLTPFAFRGDWQTTSRLLAGPVQVLNVITRRDSGISATVASQPVTGTIAIEKQRTDTLLAVFVASGTVRVMSGGNSIQPPLVPFDTVLAADIGVALLSVSAQGMTPVEIVTIRLASHAA